MRRPYGVKENIYGKVETHKEDIFKIKQCEGEFLRSFVERFQREIMMSPTIPKDWDASAFTYGLNPNSFDAS